MPKRTFYKGLSLKRALVAAAPFWLAAVASQSAHAATFNASDTAGLRTALDNTVSTGTDDTIVLAAGTYYLSGAKLDNANMSGDLDVLKTSGNLSIEAATGASVVIESFGTDRIFHILAGGSVTVTLKDITIQNGDATDDGTTAGEGRGGAILVESGNLTLDNVIVGNCIAEGADGATGVNATVPGSTGGTGGTGSDAFGGGIYMAGGTLQITGSTFTGNEAIGGDGGKGGDGPLTITGGDGGAGGVGGAASGGAVYSAGGSVTLTGSTISNSTASGGAGGKGGDGNGGSSPGDGGMGGTGGDASGGALFCAGSLTISSTQLSGNQATAGDGGNGAVGEVGSICGMGGSGGDGGAASGGAVWASAGMSVDISQFTGNTANGGDGGDGGNVQGGSLIQSPGVGGAGGAAGGGAVTASGTVSVQDSSLSSNSANGGAAGAPGNDHDGGGFTARLSANAGGSARGGALNLLAGDFSVSGSTIDQNAASGGTGGNGIDAATSGGSPANGGDAGAGGAAQGGGLYQAAGTCSIVNSTISTNQANGGVGSDGGDAVMSSADGGNAGDGGDAQGGGVFKLAGTLAFSNATVAFNSCSYGAGGTGGTAGTGGTVGSNGADGTPLGGGLRTAASTTTLDSTLLSDNDDGSSSNDTEDLAGNVTAGASLFKIAPVSSTVTPGTGANITGQDPLLGTLQNNGGSTQTHAIGSASPARDAGSNPLGLLEDQRGFARDDGNGVDIGAYEFGATSTLTASPVVTDPASTITVDAASYDIMGTAVADSLVRVYSDLNNNGTIDGSDAVVGSMQLTGGATNWTVNVPLTQSAVNSFLVTAQAAPDLPSAAVDVPDITEQASSSGGGGGDGGCSTDGGGGTNWLLFGGMLAAMLSLLRNVFRKERA